MKKVLMNSRMVFILDWKKQQEIIADIEQCFLNSDLSITKNNFKFAKKEFDKKFDDIVLCSFCLSYYTLDKFPIRKGLRVCPNCSTQLKASTLCDIDNLEKFVKFVFDYRYNGFWSKICLDIPKKELRFNEWNNRLFKLGISKFFWDNYKRMKGE